MKQALLFLLTGIALIISCKDKKQDSGKETEQPSAITTSDPGKDSTEIRAVVTGFYNWYNTHYENFMRYDLYDGIKKKDAPPYKINWDQVEKYQQFIRNSVPQLGSAFLQNQKRFLEQCDSAFKKDPEDDIPYGFDYDWYTNSQEETQYTTDMINAPAPWHIEVRSDEASVQVGGSRGEKDSGFILYMKRENGKWTISRIGEN